LKSICFIPSDLVTTVKELALSPGGRTRFWVKKTGQMLTQSPVQPLVPVAWSSVVLK
jgi:hypothetical protein